MKKNRILLVLFLALASFWAKPVSASHLIGGSMGYEYMGPSIVVGGVQYYRYNIIMTVYNNCDNQSNIPLPVATQDVSIYQHELSNNPMGGIDKVLFTTITLPLVDSSIVNPPTVSGCTIGQGVCIYKGVYEGTVDLPLSFNGYHLFFENFARNNSIDNLTNPGGTGMAFHAYIPPSLVNNGSPVFTDDPVPFLCVGDTVSILNTAIDPDGDLLIFSFVDPLAGQNGFGAPQDPIPWPLNPVNWDGGGGFSLINPFGPAGYSFINGSTGLTQYMATATGNYSVAIEIREFRNGNLIGVSRRDLQLLVINCPPNDAPNLDPTSSTQLNYSVEEGAQLCFDIDFADANGDTITLDAAGQLFDISVVNPPATLTVPVTGDSIVGAQFCWNTACGQAQALPYQFSVSVTDNGCPPKTTNVVYQVTVNPFQGPQNIFGPTILCEGESVNYTTDTIAGATYTWTVTGGTITGGQGTPGISVDWGTAGPGLVEVFAVGPLGCPSSPIQVNITIVAPPVTDAGPDEFICLGDTVQIGGSPTGPGGATYSWTPTSGLDDPTLANPMAFPATTTDYIVTTDIGLNCNGTDTVTVTVGLANIDAGNDTSYCFGDSVQLNATGGVTYVWSPTTGLSDPLIANPYVSGPDTTMYTVIVTDGSGCSGTDSVLVTAHPLPFAVAGNDQAICDGATQALGGSPTGPAGSSYSWTNGSTLNNANFPNPNATPVISPTTYIVTVNDANGCINMDTVTLTLNPNPTADAGTPATICDGDSTQLSATGGGTYAWTPTADLDNPNIADPWASPSVTTTYTVTVTDINGCTDTDDVLITVNSLPSIDAGTDTDICIGGSTPIGGSPTGPVGSTFAWTPAGTLDDPAIANPTATPIVTTTYVVTVTDANGCVAMDSLIVTVNALPIVDAGADISICDGNSTVIGGAPTGPAGSTYAWTPAGTLDDAALANPTATPTVSPTTYTVTVTDPNGCVNTADVTVTLFPLPTPDAGTDATICIGDSTQLNATGGGTYAWTPITGLSDPNIADPWASPTTTTQYTVTVTDGNGCSASDSVIITVNPLPIVDPGANDSICIGESILIGGAPTGPAGSTFVWTPAATLDDPSIANPTATPTVTTTYVVTVTDLNGCVAMDSLEIFVNPLPVVDAGADISICDGNSTVLGGAPTGPAGSIYAWTPAGTLDDAALANPTATPTVSPTTYTVTVTDPNGCVNTADVTVTLFPLPTPDAGTDATICVGDSTQLNATGGGTYAWTPITGLSDPNIADPWASPTTTTQYTVTVTDGNGCFASDSVIITVNPLPIVDAGSDLTICLLDTVAIGGAPTGPASSTYAWTPIADLNDPSLENPNAWPSVTTTYYVTVTDLNGCVNIDSMILNVNPLPPADAGLDATICDGDSAQLNASGGVSYSWSPITDLSDPNIADPWASPSTTTSYIVTVTDLNNCSTTDTVDVIVNNIPPADAGPDVTICIGDSTQFNATGGTIYVWSPITDLSDPNIADPWASPTDTTTYIVDVTAANGCFGQDSLTVFVLDIPTADAGPDLWLCDANNNSVQLNATGGVSYSWSPITGLTDPLIADPLASPTDTTAYIVTVTDGNGCMDMDTVVVIVNDDPPIDMGIGGQICIGDTILLGGTPTSVPGSIYTWSPNGTLDDGSIANPMAFPTDTTMYYLTVQNDTCSSMDSVMVVVNPLPTASAGPDVQICFGDSAQLMATGGDIYAWTPTATLSDSMIFDPWASPTDTTEYIVTVVDSNACVNMDSVWVIVNPTPVIDAGPDTAICFNDSTQLMATGGMTYSWSPTNGLSDSLIADPMTSPAITTLYYVTAIDSNGCTNMDSVLITVNALPIIDAGSDATICAGDSTQLGASGGVSYIWTPTGDLSDSLVADPWASPTDTMMYWATGTDANGCMNTDSVTVAVNQNPIANAGPDAAICTGAQAHLLATGGVSYSWTPVADLDDPNVADPWATPTTTTTYVVTVTDANGCSSMDSLVLTINPLPIADAGADVNICLGDTAQLNATGGTTYTWTPATNINDNLIADPLVYPDTTGYYYVAVRDVNNCEAIDSVLVSVFRITVEMDTSLCEGDSVQLLASGPNANNFVWSPTNGLSDPNIADPWASPSTTTTYTATLTNIDGCMDQGSVTVTIDPSPVAMFDVETEANCDGLKLSFNNTTDGGETYVWNFGPETSDEMNPEYTYAYEEDYLVLLTATNEFGCSDTATFSSSVLKFEDYFDIVIPNVFTPNGDGINDLFELNLPGRLGDCVELNIFNRWGQTVFVSTGNNIVWDGRTPSGEVVTNGTYFFTLSIQGVEYKGSVTILD